MPPGLSVGCAALLGYLVGSVPFAYLLVKVRTGRDLRREGSGNVGATNATRILGRRWFLVVFLLDAAKGAGSALAVPALLGTVASGGALPWLGAAAAAGAVLGHTFPCFLGFRGGKAVATGAGTLAVLAPMPLAAGVAAFAVAAAATRWVSAGSLAAAAAVGAARLLLPAGDGTAPFDAPALPATAFLLLLSSVVVVRHLPNVRRMMAGTEPRIGAPRTAEPGSAPGTEESR